MRPAARPATSVGRLLLAPPESHSGMGASFDRSESIVPVDRAYYEEIAGVLHGLLIRLDDRLPGKDVSLIAEFIDADELGLALEQIADLLSKDKQPVSAEERADILSLAKRMRMGNSIPRALATCPEP